MTASTSHPTNPFLILINLHLKILCSVMKYRQLRIGKRLVIWNPQSHQIQWEVHNIKISFQDLLAFNTTISQYLTTFMKIIFHNLKGKLLSMNIKIIYHQSLRLRMQNHINNYRNVMIINQLQNNNSIQTFIQILLINHVFVIIKM